MPVQNNAPLQLFILFLLLINGCQQGNVDSTNSAGISADNEKLDELMNKMDEMKKQNIELKNVMEKMMEEFKAELNEMKKLMKNKEEIEVKKEETKLKGKTHNLLMQIQEKMKNNKLNKEDCGPHLKLEISPVNSNIILKHSGDSKLGWSTVRAISPISKYNSHDNSPSIAGYYEVEILNTGSAKYFGGSGCVIGFCDKKFPLEFKMLGNVNNSIGIWDKKGMHIDGEYIEFENDNEDFKKNDNQYFQVKDFVGIGIIHHKSNSKMECFATWNGKLLGKVELRPKFANIQLFPAVILSITDDSVIPNFGKHDWRFKEFEHLLEENARTADDKQKREK